MFWIAVGMLLALLIPSVWVTVLLIGALLAVGYNLFC